MKEMIAEIPGNHMLTARGQNERSLRVTKGYIVEVEGIITDGVVE